MQLYVARKVVLCLCLGRSLLTRAEDFRVFCHFPVPLRCCLGAPLFEKGRQSIPALRPGGPGISTVFANGLEVIFAAISFRFKSLGDTVMLTESSLCVRNDLAVLDVAVNESNGNPSSRGACILMKFEKTVECKWV